MHCDKTEPGSQSGIGVTCRKTTEGTPESKDVTRNTMNVSGPAPNIISGRPMRTPVSEMMRVAVCAVLLMEQIVLVACAAGKGPLPNVSSRVLSLMQAVEDTSAQWNSGAQGIGSPQGVRLDEVGRLEVMIDVTEVTRDILNELEARGCSIEIYDRAQHLVQAWVPMERLREVAGLPFVKFLDLPNYGVTNQPDD